MRVYVLYIVPLAYQHQFSKLIKGNFQTWSDYIWEKKSVCNKWFKAKEVLSVEDCKQLIDILCWYVIFQIFKNIRSREIP